MRNRIPFEVLSLEIEKLYSKSFSIPHQDTERINQHCEFVSEFIRACGWSEEEYISRMFNFDQKN